MAFVSKLPMITEESRNIHPGTLPRPPDSSLGAIDPVSTGVQAAGAIASSVAALAPSGSIIGVGVGGGVVVGLSTAAFAGIGLALAVVVIIYNLIMNNQKKVKANRIARHARWKAFYETGDALINEVYGHVARYFTWSRLHSADEGFGDYYALGATFYWWRGGTSHRDPRKTEEDFRRDLVSFLKGRGVDPTRIMGDQNVKKEEDLVLKDDYVALPERIMVMREVLGGMGYTADDLNKAQDEEIYNYFFDTIMKDLPNIKTNIDAYAIMRDINAYLEMLGLNSDTFFKKINSSSLPAPTNSVAVVAQQPVQVVTSQVDPSALQTQPIPIPTAAPIIPVVASVEEAPKLLAAGMPLWGWLVIAGIGISVLVGSKKGGI